MSAAAYTAFSVYFALTSVLAASMGNEWKAWVLACFASITAYGARSGAPNQEEGK